MSIQKTLVFLLCFMSACLPAWSQEYWLEFNPYAFSTEYFWENNKKMGSCAAAAVVIVEHHLELKGAILSSAVNTKNTAMKRVFEYEILDGDNADYYIFHINSVQSALISNGYKTQLRTFDNDRSAMEYIYKGLDEKKWVIILAAYGLNGNSDLAHFYPVYGGYKGRSVSTSTINVIDSLASNSSRWEEKYKTGIPLDDAMKSMSLASQYANRNILLVWK